MQKIVILGGNSYIAKAFIERYYDRFDMKVIKRDSVLKDYFDLKREDLLGFDTVINFTAIVHQKKASEALHERYNFSLVKYLADLAKEAEVSHFVHFSTIAVYGDVSYIDSKTPTKPTTPYGRYKLEADSYLSTLDHSDFIVTLIRPPVVYGKDAPGNMKQLWRLVNRGYPLPLAYRDNHRTILCIDNLLIALKRILDKKASGIFLLKDKESPSIGELVGYMQLMSIGKERMIKMPHLLYDLLLKSRIGVFRKLFGNLEIDDSVSIEKLGNYAAYSWKECIDKNNQY